MSHIGDALKRAGGTEIAGTPVAVPLAVDDLPLADTFVSDPSVQSAAVEGPESEPSQPLMLGGTVVRPDSRLVVNPDLPAVAVEQYRRLAATLHHVQEDRGIRRVLISSAVADEGKTLTSTNLAITLSHSYAKKVLLIDADLRRPRINVVFGLPTGPGLSEALDRREPGKLPIAKVSSLLSILPAGRAKPDPIAGLTSSRMAAILDDAVAQFDWVIVDTPPVGLLSDARLLGAMVDAALLVVGAGSTPAEVIQRAIEGLGRERILGVVLNRVDETIAAGGEYYYQYYGHYGHSDGRNGNGNRHGGFLRRLLKRR